MGCRDFSDGRLAQEEAAGILSCSVLAEGADWIDPAGAAGRSKAGQKRGKHQHRNHDDESGWLVGLHSVYCMHQYASCRQSRKYAYSHSDENHSKALPEHHPRNLASGRPKRHAHANFRYPLSGQVGQYPINADARKKQSQACKDGEQQQKETLCGDRVFGELLHGVNLVEHLIVGNAAHLAAQGLDDAQWVDTGADGDRHELGPAPQELVGDLGEGIIELRAYLSLVVGGQPPLAHMAHDADDGDGVRTDPDPDVLADGVLPGESLLRHYVIDHRDRLAALTVLVVDEAST